MIMQVFFSSRFQRAYRKLSKEDRLRADAALLVFSRQPFAPSLRNHKLAGSKEGIRSISAGYDLRLLYIEQDGHVVIVFVDIGAHDEVY